MRRAAALWDANGAPTQTVSISEANRPKASEIGRIQEKDRLDGPVEHDPGRPRISRDVLGEPGEEDGGHRSGDDPRFS